MSEIDIGFSGGTTVVDKLIQTVSGAVQEDITHAFAMIYDRPYEALGIMIGDELYPQARFRARDKYKGITKVKYIRIDVPNIDSLIDKAIELDGTPYGYTDCISTGLKILLDEDILVDGTRTVMCAELIARILIAGGLDICPELSPDQIAPIVLYRELVNNFNGQDVTNEYIEKEV